MTGMALLPIEAIFFLTRSNVHWKQSILFVIGLAIIILPPAAYITQFNVWAQEKVEDFGFEVEGIGWVATYNAGRTGPDLVRYATSAYLLSWEWPKLSEEPKIQPWILTTLKAATVLVLMLAGVGAMPWSKRLRGLRDDEHLPQPWWRVFLWLGLWLILPIYFMYCRSLPDFSAPKVWWNELARLLAGSAWQSKDGTISGYFWLFLSLAAAMVAALTIIFARFRRSLVWLTPLVAGALLVVCLLRSGVPRTTPQGLQWVQVIFRPLVTWADWISEPFVFTSLAIVLPGLLLLYCGPTWGQRATRIAQFVLASAALVGCCWLVYMVVQSKFDKEIAQMTRRFAAQDPADAPFIKRYNTPRAAVETSLWQSIFMPRYVGFVWIAFCIALCALLMRLPTRLLRFAAIALLVAVNLAQFSGRLFAGTEPPLDRVAKEIWKHDTLHNRGFAWLVPPDVRDLIAALIPPSERAHALHLLWGIGDASGRVYVNDTQVASSGHPGYGILNLQQGKYYLGLARGYFIAPSEWKRIDSSRDFEIHLLRTPRGRQGLSDYSTIAAEIRRSSGLKKIIVWEKYFDETTDRKDHLSSLLGTQWKLASDQDYSVRLHWNWTDLYIYRRSEYVKTETGPALRTVSTPGR